MSVQQRVLRRAASWIGYQAHKDPEPGSMAGRYMAAKLGQPWLAGSSRTVWWCMCFVSMCLDQEGQAGAIGGMTFNTDRAKANMRTIGLAPVPFRDARPGDVIIFDWNRDGITDHVGFVERNLGGGIVQTIEGNTSPGTKGSQSAGNGVWRRKRSTYGVDSVWRPAYTGTTPPTHTESTNTSGSEESDMNTGIYWNEDPKTIIYAICNPESGFWTEWSAGKGKGAMSGKYNNALAAGFRTGSFVYLSKSHAAAIKRDCAAVRTIGGN